MRHHVVLFTLHEGADEQAAMDAIEASRPPAGVVSWEVHRSLDERKGVVIAEVATFESVAAFETFRDSPAHRSVGRFMSGISDWVVADWDA